MYVCLAVTGAGETSPRSTYQPSPLSSVSCRYAGKEGLVVDSGETLDTPSLRRLASTMKGLFGNPLTSDADPVVRHGAIWGEVASMPMRLRN